VAHYDQVAIVLCVLQRYSQNVAKTVKAGSALAFSVVNGESSILVKEFEEVQGFHNAADGAFLSPSVSTQKPEIGSAEDSFAELTVPLGQTLRQNITEPLSVTLKSLSWHQREPPSAQVSQRADIVGNRVV